MGKFERSWLLLQCSLKVIFQNKTLLVFPLVITFLSCVIALFFICPIVLWDTGYSYTDAQHWQTMASRWVTADEVAEEYVINPVTYAVMAGLYLVSMFLATFFNVAFYSQIINGLKGQPVSIKAGFKLATSRLGPIIMWSLFTGVIGLIIKALEERVDIVGRWIVKLIGIAWSVASIFVVPVIVQEQSTLNPAKMLKSSATILRRTWGESLVGYLGVQFGAMLVFFGSIVLLGLGGYLSYHFDNAWIIGIVALVWFVSLVAYMYLLNVASQVYMGALYLYAAEGSVSAPYTRDQMSVAWKAKS